MDYKGIEEEVRKHSQALEEIDQKGLMYHFRVRNLRTAEANKDRDQRTYQARLEDMQAPLCLATIIEALEADGWSVLPVSYEERGEKMILKGKTSDDKDYKLIHEREPDYGDFIVTYVGKEEVGRHPIFEYKKDLFAERKSLLSSLRGHLKR